MDAVGSWEGYVYCGTLFEERRATCCYSVLIGLQTFELYNEIFCLSAHASHHPHAMNIHILETSWMVPPTSSSQQKLAASMTFGR